MIRCQVQRDPFSRTVKIWFFQERTELSREFKVLDLREDPAGVWKTIEEGELRSEPSIELPEYLANALAPELVALMPPNESMHVHLQDTIGVRDRLLTLVEQLAG